MRGHQRQDLHRRQELFSRKFPQRLKALRGHALIESAVSSNRIEGVEVDRSRIAAVVLGGARLRDRNEERVGPAVSPRGSKTALIEAAVQEFAENFTIGDVERACPSTSRELIRRVLRRLATDGIVECRGRGPGARWVRKGTVEK